MMLADMGLLAQTNTAFGYGIGIAAVCATLTGAVVAFLGWLNSQEKLRLELYDRRYKIYEGIRQTITDLFAAEGVEEGANVANRLIALQIEGKFLFAGAVANNISRLNEIADAYIFARGQYQSLKDTRAHIPEIISDGLTQAALDLRRQDIVIVNLIAPFLDFHNIGLRRHPFALRARLWISGSWQKMIDDMERAKS